VVDNRSVGVHPPIDVVLVEDNDVFRDALGLLLGLTPDVRVVAAVPDGHTALEVCPPLDPDVVVMDYRLPGGLDGVEATAAMREACPSAAVVVLTAAAETDELRALHEAGAVACLTKDGDLDGIVSAIRDAAQPR
jgi:two-component system, NarL family, response regulator DesR